MVDIREIRKYKLRMTRKELAKAINTSEQSIYFWETGQRHPNFENILALSKLSNTPIEKFRRTSHAKG